MMTGTSEARSEALESESTTVGDEPPKTARQLRLAAGLTMMQCAVAAKTAEATLRLYLADRLAVSHRARTKLDAYFARVALMLARGSRAGPGDRSPAGSEMVVRDRAPYRESDGEP